MTRTSPAPTVARLEAEALRAFNAVAEPLVRAGFGSPGVLPWGAVVLETTGRRSGRAHRVPVLATVLGDLLLVGSVRPGSQWIRNLAAEPRVHYWMNGRRRPARAVVLGPGGGLPDPRAATPLLAWLAMGLAPWAALGVSFAILTPAAEAPAAARGPARG